MRVLTLTDVLGEPLDTPEVVAARKAFSDGPIARALLAPGPDDVYAKWQGAFWRLAALVELGGFRLTSQLHTTSCGQS